MNPNEVSGKDVKEAIQYLAHVATQGKLNISLNDSEVIKKNIQSCIALAESIGDDAVLFTPPTSGVMPVDADGNGNVADILPKDTLEKLAAAAAEEAVEELTDE